MGDGATTERCVICGNGWDQPVHGSRCAWEMLYFDPNAASLRAYFAAKAMQGLLAKVGMHRTQEYLHMEADPGIVAMNAIAFADALLAALTKEHTNA